MLIVYFGRDRTRQRTAYKNLVARLEAKSLLAQMNPHFIYNTLNGIQSVMMLKGEKEANKYIGIFGRILRQTLEMSSTDHMTIAEELDYLRGYVKLQNMRFNNPVKLIEMVPSIADQKKHTIPPMLIQPIIENSFTHGLSPLNRQGYIHLSISLGESRMFITVEDNGVGRKEAQKKKRLKQSSSNRKSQATKILMERIDLFNYFQKIVSAFFLEDVITDNKIAGTKATLILPKKEKKKKRNEKAEDSTR